MVPLDPATIDALQDVLEGCRSRLDHVSEDKRPAEKRRIITEIRTTYGLPAAHFLMTCLDVQGVVHQHISFSVEQVSIMSESYRGSQVVRGDATNVAQGCGAKAAARDISVVHESVRAAAKGDSELELALKDVEIRLRSLEESDSARELAIEHFDRLVAELKEPEPDQCKVRAFLASLTAITGSIEAVVKLAEMVSRISDSGAV